MTPERAGQLLEAVQLIRDELPVVGLAIDAVDPAAAPFVAVAEGVLGKVFEAAVAYLQHESPEAAQEALRAKVVQGWGGMLGAKVTSG